MRTEATPESVYADIRAGFGPDLCRLMDGPGWSDIMVNPDGSVWIDRDVMTRVECRTDVNGLASAALTLASWTNQKFDCEKSQGLVAVVPVALYRIFILSPPAVERISLTMRRPQGRVISPEAMVAMGTATASQMDYLRRAAEGKRNIVIAGGTGSGKTTFMNSILSMIPSCERVYVIEDTPELLLSQPNVFPVRENRSYSYEMAIQDALRGRPDRIIIGECRKGDQTLEMLKAWNTGHPGGMTTIHANSAADVPVRMDQLCSEVSVSSQDRMIREAVDVVCQMRRTEGIKRVVSELVDMKTGKEIA